MGEKYGRNEVQQFFLEIDQLNNSEQCYIRLQIKYKAQIHKCNKNKQKIKNDIKSVLIDVKIQIKIKKRFQKIVELRINKKVLDVI